MSTTQALADARAMVADLARAETLADLDALHVDWIGYSTLQDDPGQTIADMRGVLADYVREFCFTCGIHCDDAGIPRDDD